MDTRTPALKVLAAAVILAALISLICPSVITVKPIFLLAAIALALVRSLVICVHFKAGCIVEGIAGTSSRSQSHWQTVNNSKIL